MLFNSYEFIFLFLPLALLGFFLLGRWSGERFPHRPALWLIAVSLFFYGWWKPIYLLLLALSIVANYFLGVAINRALESAAPRRARGILFAGIAANLLLLGYYKYAAFALASLAGVFGLSIAFAAPELPLAISFYTFTQIAYLVDAWRGHTRVYNFLHYTLFVTFFPHLIAGPIVLYRSLMPQFMQRSVWRFQPAQFLAGVTLFIIGLSKKVLLADRVAPLAETLFAAGSGAPSAANAWVGAVAYAMQLYFDFSGYSDMAIGLARMFNVGFPQNFHSPYKAADIIDFWRRWHITLSTFLRDHLYIPLGGNRKGPARRWFNLFLTMLLGGLWHGANWTFLIWGALHGVYLIINHAWAGFAKERAWASTAAARWAGRVVTFVAVLIGWVFFRAHSLEQAVTILQAMAGLRTGAGSPEAVGDVALLLGVCLIAFVAPNSEQLMRLSQPEKVTAAGQPQPLLRPSPLLAAVAALLFVGCVLHFSRVSQFLYFQF